MDCPGFFYVAGPITLLTAWLRCALRSLQLFRDLQVSADHSGPGEGLPQNRSPGGGFGLAHRDWDVSE